MQDSTINDPDQALPSSTRPIGGPIPGLAPNPEAGPVTGGEAARADPAVGRVLGHRYRLIAPLGSGASAQVYLAEDLSLGRQVAVKRLRQALSDDSRFIRRFRAEAKAAARLSHPNLLAVYDWGEDESSAYIVTEVLLGGSLLDLLERTSRLTPSQGLLVALQVAQGLHYAHDLGWVHRDIKPANLLFGDEGRLRIADFGIARAVAEAAWTEPEGHLVGTARYAAPEQADGVVVDGKADIYALGLTVMEAITGNVPLLGESALATMVLRQDRNVPEIAQLGPLGRAILPTVRANPAERPSAAELIEALSETARALPRPRRLSLTSLNEPTATVDLRPEPADRRRSRQDEVQSRPIRRPVAATSNSAQSAWLGSDQPPPVTFLDRSSVTPSPPEAPASMSPSAATLENTPLENTAPEDASRKGATPASTAPEKMSPILERPRQGGLSGSTAAPWSRRRVAREPSRPVRLTRLADEQPITRVEVVDGIHFEKPGTDAPSLRLNELEPGVDDAATAAAEERSGRVLDPMVVEDRPRWWVIGILVALIAMVVIGAVIANGDDGETGTERQPSTTPAAATVADLVGESLSSVETQAENNGWILSVSETRRNGTERNEVLEQAPEPGSPIDAGERLRLVVSLGPELTPLPTIVGRSLDEASERIRQAGFTVGSIVDVEANAPVGEVVGVEIDGDEVGARFDLGTAIDLMVSTGPADAPMPSFVGLTLDRALAQAEELGLEVTTTEGYSPRYETGFVFDTEPPTDAPVSPGDTVNLVVSLGKATVPSGLATVPNVVGMSTGEASDALTSAGFTVAEIFGKPDRDVVATQPLIGESHPRGTSITIYTKP